MTGQRKPVPAVVVKRKQMKYARCPATSLANTDASDIVRVYGRRFSIEETFRDTKDITFGMGLRANAYSQDRAPRPQAASDRHRSHADDLVGRGARSLRARADAQDEQLAEAYHVALQSMSCCQLSLPHMREERLEHLLMPTRRFSVSARSSVRSSSSSLPQSSKNEGMLSDVT